MSEQNTNREKLADSAIRDLVVWAALQGDSAGTREEAEARFDTWLRDHDDQMRREAAAEQREKDAQIAEQHGAPEPSRRFSPEHWDEWRERTSITIAAAIREGQD